MGTNFKNLICLIEKNGWKYDRTKGSHYIYVKNGIALSVPKYNKNIGKGLYHKILKEAGIK
nr:type II toxin-antitoxin system HicA family toxin [Fusobacterium nucleatum]